LSNIFLYAYDPRQAYSSSAMLLATKQHLLLFDKLFVQDNFLVSDVFFHFGSRNLISLLERGWLSIALRDQSFSLVNLKEQLLIKARKQEYMPFEEFSSGIELYKRKEFTNYLSEVDTRLSEPNACVLWNPKDLGKEFTDKMWRSASDGTSGFSIDQATSIWDKINKDERIKDGIQSRTLYKDYGDSLENREIADQIMQWTTRVYLGNLPDYLDVESSAPEILTINNRLLNPIHNISNIEVGVGELSPLLIPEFLDGIDFEDIEKFRSLSEFSDLQRARRNNNPEQLLGCLSNYIKAISDIAPEHYGPYKERINQLKRHIKMKTFMQAGAIASGGAISWSSALGFVFAPDAALAGMAVSLLGFAMSVIQGTEGILKEAKKNSFEKLKIAEFKGKATNDFNFYHLDSLNKKK